MFGSRCGFHPTTRPQLSWDGEQGCDLVLPENYRTGNFRRENYSGMPLGSSPWEGSPGVGSELTSVRQAQPMLSPPARFTETQDLWQKGRNPPIVMA